ncbi:MAG: tetratricopeptide repeat protein [Planctomycetota bacterium]
MSAADYDNDGDLDLYGTRYKSPFSVEDLFCRPNSYRQAESGGRNLLLRNDEAWRFTDATENAGLGVGNHRYSRSAIWLDYDLDGDQDLYVVNELHFDQLYSNAEGWFTESAVSSLNDRAAIQRSASVGDFDGDSRPDFFIATAVSPIASREIKSMPGQPSAVEENFLAGCRVLLAGGADINPRSYRLPSPVFVPGHASATAALDINNDGFDDVLMTNGGLTRRRMEDVSGLAFRSGVVAQRGLDENRATITVRNAFSSVASLGRQGFSYEAEQRNRCFLSLGRTGFANFSACSGFDEDDDGRAIATSDWDGDGDVDVITNCRTGPRLRLFSNQLATANQWVSFDLQGTNSNRDAIGSRVEVFLTGRESPVTRFLLAGSGSNSQSSKRLVVGLGADPQISQVVVYWPDGSIQQFEDIKPERKYTLVQGEDNPVESTTDRSELVSLTASPPPPPVIVASEMPEVAVFYPRHELPLLQFQGAENEFFQVENFDGRPVLVVFWTRDTTSEAVLKSIGEQASRYNEAGIDLIAIYIDQESDSISGDWSNARDSIEETDYPFRWGTAAPSTVQKLELLKGDWFADEDIANMPVAILLDGQGRVAVHYSGNEICFESVEHDLGLLSLRPTQYRHAASPFSGIWLAPYRQPSYLRLISVFRDYGFEDDVEQLSIYQNRATAVELTQRGLDFESAGKPELALKEYRSALEHHSECVPAQIALGKLYMSNFQSETDPNLRDQYLDLALARFEAAISIDPTNAEAILQSSVIYQTRGEIDEAIQTLNDYLTMDPDRWVVHAAIGRLHYQQNELRKAATFLVNAYEHRPSLPGVAGDLGCLYLKNKQYDDGLKYLRRAHELQPNDPFQNSWLVYAEFLNGNFQEATELALETAENQRDQRSQSILSWLMATSPYEDHRNGQRAVEIITPQVLVRGGVSPKVLEIQAAALAECGEYSRAEVIQRKAIEMVESGTSDDRYTDQQKEGMATRLELYVDERPFRMSELTSVPIDLPSLD